jgi:hypothetical protein
VDPHYDSAPWERLSPSSWGGWLFDSAQGPGEAVLVVIVAAYATLAIFTNRGRLRQGFDRSLGMVAGLLVLVALLAPDQWIDTVFFAQRFAAPALAVLLLALPAPRIAPRVLLPIAGVVTLASALHTASAWRRFEASELTGLSESIRADPAPRRVLGLDFDRTSAVVEGQPFMQSFAWLIAVNGGEAGFSFAENASGIVAYRRPRRITWQPRLEEDPDRVSGSDLEQFDVVLLTASPGRHRRFDAETGAVDLMGEGHVRLHRLSRGPHALPMPRRRSASMP